ncbi:MAG: 2-amino-4-hydroxy-6-hydroxymethyldihydropteridine diphosphokinase [Actinobacteria bacterium]|nr:MAG: 2-amino-4-hydroxy-6-hydroxymethyldihydropteridine diphosphokinase [Actinomycetota bacterium]
MAKRTTAYIGIGSNTGDRLLHLTSAVERLDESENVSVTKRSSVYESEPEGPSRNPFFNGVVEVRTTLKPKELLALCQEIEAAHGRVRAVRWGDRTLDLDILLYDDLTVDEPYLRIPHPRMWTREFVCVPLAEIAPERLVPDRRACIAGRIIRKVEA